MLWAKCSTLALTFLAFASALPHHKLEERYVTTFTAPNNYRFSWGIDGERCSYGTSTGQYLTRSAIDGATSVTQKAINSCAVKCDNTLQCDFFHPVQMRGGAEGTVICALYNTKQSKTSATFSSGASSSGGTVVVSYGFTRNSPVVRVVVPSTSSTTSHSSTSSRAVTTSSSARSSTRGTTVSTSSRHTATSSTGRTSSSTRRSTSSTTRPTTSSSSSSTSSRVLATSTSSSTHSLTTSVTGSGAATSSSGRTTTTSSAASRSTTTVSSSRVSTTTSRSGNTTSLTATSSSSAATVSMPRAPNGARLVQFKGCPSSTGTVPMFVSTKYPKKSTVSSARTAWIVQHGSSRSFDDYFTSVYDVVGDNGVIIAPNFYSVGDTPAPNGWYQPSRNLAWNSNDWQNAADAVSPAGVSSCSSFDVYDTLISSLRDKSKYPNLQTIYIVAHSAGAAMMGRYGMLSSDASIKYVLANAPVMAYPTDARPVPHSSCTRGVTFGYGWESRLPRYVAARGPSGPRTFRNWVSRDVTLMTGTLDTYSRDQTGDQSCSALAQGGQNRRDRGYAFWAYINLLAGTGTDVSKYYGYSALKSQVSSMSVPAFNVRHCVVSGVAHNNNGMFASACGQAAIRGASSLPAGPGPIRPA